MSVQVHVIETEELGDRSYVATDGSVAVVIDPQRDLDRVEAVLAETGTRLALVLETHVHNDYVTGGYALARRHGAEYVVNGEDPVGFERTAIRDGDVLTAGSMEITALATPGHTETHLAYRVTDRDEPGAAPLVFTGGSLLFGSVGRTDLVDPDRTEELTHAQYRSARRLAATLPDPTAVYPTHGFGSFCSSGETTGKEASTIGEQRAENDALTTDDEQRFVETLIANLTAYPTYYAHMGPLNLAGPGAVELEEPAIADPEELARRIEAGEWVVDLRSRTAFAADHVHGTVSIELGSSFATYVGWLIPWGTPLTLIADAADEVRDAQRQLVRIGIDELAAAATGNLDEAAAGLKRAAYPRLTFAETRNLRPEDTILDVRRDDERKISHIEGSAHAPVHSLLRQLDELPAGRLWIHCATGLRSGMAASLLEREGREVVHIDDNFENAERAGLRIVTN